MQLAPNRNIFNRIITNTSLMSGTADNSFNDGWTGLGAERYLQNDAQTARARLPLAQEIWHPINSPLGLHWYPQRGDQALDFGNEIAATEKMTLWVRGPEPLPGTENNPFTSLFQAATVTSPGIYYFDLGGETFNTYVDDQGYVQIALEYGEDAPPLGAPPTRFPARYRPWHPYTRRAGFANRNDGSTDELIRT